MDAEFRWNAWNLDHATRHGCTIPEIESVVLRAEVTVGLARKGTENIWLWAGG